jgi:hypothetical protein
MRSNAWLKYYEGELDMIFHTSLKMKENVMKINAKKNKKKNSTHHVPK